MIKPGVVIIALSLLSPNLAAQTGKTLFQQCAACHSLQAGQNNMGPSLHNVWQRKAGSLEGYRYSSRMQKSNVTWDEKSLDKFLENPQGFIPGNRMPFAGISDESQRQKLIEYLKKQTK